MRYLIFTLLLLISCSQTIDRKEIIPEDSSLKTSPQLFVERFYSFYMSGKPILYPLDLFKYKEKVFGKSITLSESSIALDKFDSLNIDFLNNYYNNRDYLDQSPISIFNYIINSYDYGVVDPTKHDFPKLRSNLDGYNGFESGLLDILIGDFDSSENHLPYMSRDQKGYILLHYSLDRLEKYGYSTHREVINDIDIKDISRIDLLYLFGLKMMRDKKVLNFAKAFTFFDTYSRYNPSSEIFNLMGYCLLQNGDEVSAIKLSKKGVELDSADWRNHYHLGTNLYHSDKDEATISFNKAISLGDSLDSHLYLGKIYYEKGDYKTAIFHYRERMRHSYGDGTYRKEAAKGVRKCLEQLRGDDVKD